MEQTRLRFLVVTAHPHDFTHCAGTCGIHTSLGDSVTVVSVTPGVDTHNQRLHDEMMKLPEERDPSIVNQTLEEFAAIKTEELRQACTLFGITDVRVLNFPQPFLMERHPEVVDTLKDIIYEVRPHVLITQRPYLDGPHGFASGALNDHSETAFAVLEARGAAGISTHGSTQRPHTIAATYYPGVYFERNQFDLVVDISDWYEQRVQAELMFKSQGHTEAFARKRIEIGVGNMGWSAGTAYAEAFVREKPDVLPRIIVPESVLRQASEPDSDHQKRIVG